ncbi:MAG: hypothetical protein ABSA13_17760 [Beijerinckiaceae bacterium]|jgi:hypothetical protein
MSRCIFSDLVDDRPFPGYAGNAQGTVDDAALVNSYRDRELATRRLTRANRDKKFVNFGSQNAGLLAESLGSP